MKNNYGCMMGRQGLEVNGIGLKGGRVGLMEMGVG